MWDRWKESNTSVKNPPNATGTYPTVSAVATPPAAQPARPAAAAAPAYADTVREVPSARGGTMIGKSMIVKGEITCNEDLRIEGTVEGPLTVESHRLTLGVAGAVKSDIKAREVIVEGKIRGNVDASEKIAIGKAGELIGDIRTAGITIEDGGYFRGSVDIVRKPAQKQPAPVETE
jgi:cytoskeletal protein CcmA (bactofilin family)